MGNAPPLYWFNKVVRRLRRPRLAPPSAAEGALIDALRTRIRALPAIRGDGSSTDALWLQNRARLRSELLTKDPRTLVGFPVIRETMFVDHPPYIGQELRALRSAAGWRERWRTAIRESDSVPAPPCPYFMESSGNLIHQAYHLSEFERVTRQALDVSRMDAILEFGGGYGSMCRLVRRLGFRGRYFIYDLPEFSALQEFYLRANDVGVSSLESRVPGAICLSEPGQLDEVASSVPLDLFIATWSLSETPLELRERLLGRLDARRWLIGYQDRFGALDNAGFFDGWRRTRPDRRWWHVPLHHMPDRHSYLFGAPAEA